MSLSHKTVKAAATTTDQGQFSAIAAAYSVDRVGDAIVPGAFAKTIKAWQSAGKLIPLHWDHESSPESIIGSINPAAMRETKDGLFVEGQLDLENSEIAREVWRSMKAGVLSLSFGYLAVKSRQEGDVNKLLELDLYEVSVVAAPANNDTRLLSLKSVREELGLSAEAVDGVIVQKAEWTTAYINDLADSCFLYIEAGGEKDEDGRTTPRSLRHFPVKDASGTVDMPHLRNALSRIPQANLPQPVKDRLTAMAQRMLDTAKSGEPEFKDIEAVQSYLDEKFPGHTITETSEEGRKANPLIAEAWALMTPRKASAPPPDPEVEPEPEEPLNSTEVKSEAWALALKPRST